MLLIAPAKKVEILRLSMLYGHACFSLSCPCGRTMFECILVLSYFHAVSFSWVSPELRFDAPPAVPYFCFPVWFSTLLTGRCGRNCLYLNWLGNKSLAKRYHWRGVLADSCRGLNLATPSSSVSYHECVRNHACQEGRNSGLSLIGFRKFICACPCIIAPMVRSRPQVPDGNQPLLTKLCKYRPDFTPFGHFYQFCLKFATFLHRLYCSDLSWLVFTEYHLYKLTLCHIYQFAVNNACYLYRL